MRFKSCEIKLVTVLLLAELTELIEELQQCTEEAMEIEMAPWVHNYTVPMDELYTDLTLEQIKNKPTGPISVKVDNYAQFFAEEPTGNQEKPNVRQIIRGRGKRKKGKKILAKGDPGTGKSTFGKKIAYDWAKGVFTAVSVVFFVSMKLIRPGQTIENIIIERNPRIESLEITEEKLCYILKNLGSRCLIILDGLDECDLRERDDIHKIIKGAKLAHCSILVTSRPHNCTEIEKWFSTKVRVKGFTKEQAKVFTSKYLNDNEKVQRVYELKARNFLSADSYCNPMLLLFLCVLENDGELDNNVAYLGEIYFRLIRCMYRKYCVRKRIEFNSNEFLQVLKSVGKIAWEMLDSGTNFAKEIDLIRELGSDTFEYGLFAGHIDHRLASKETKDIFVAFVHQTIQEFLGVFHCVSLLNTKGKMSFSDRSRYSLTNSYFLKFALWLSDKCSYVQFEREAIHTALAQHLSHKIDISQLDLNMFPIVFPVLNMSTYKEGDCMSTGFMKKMLSLCKKVKELYVNSYHATKEILEALSASVLSSLRLVANKSVLDECDFISFDDLNVSDNQVVILEYTKPYLGMTHVLKRFTSKPIGLVVLAKHGEENVEITGFCHEYLSKFHICAQTHGHLTAENHFPSFLFLTEISISNFCFQECFLKALSLAVEKKHFPVLNQLIFRSCGSSLKGKLHLLFQSTWPKLTHLSMIRCLLDNTDIQVVQGTKGKRCVLPNLISLTLELTDLLDIVLCDLPFDRVRSNLFSMLSTSCRALTGLFLHHVTKTEYQGLALLINSGNLPSLKNIGVSMWSLVERHKMNFQTTVGKNYSVQQLRPVCLKTLTTLSLRRFVCAQTHLLTAARSAKFSNVHKLDISHSSYISGKLFILVSHSFHSLKSLILSDCGLTPNDLSSLAEAGAESRLPELRHLDISENKNVQGHLKKLFPWNQKWSRLLSLYAHQNPETLSGEDLQVILSLARSGCLSSLTELQVSMSNVGTIENYLGSPWPSLTSLHIVVPPDLRIIATTLKAVREFHEKGLFPKLEHFRLMSIKEKIDITMETLFQSITSGEIEKDVSDNFVTHMMKGYVDEFTFHSQVYSTASCVPSLVSSLDGFRPDPSHSTESEICRLVFQYVSGEISDNTLEQKLVGFCRDTRSIEKENDCSLLRTSIDCLRMALKKGFVFDHPEAESLSSIKYFRENGVHVISVFTNIENR